MRKREKEEKERERERTEEREREKIYKNKDDPFKRWDLGNKWPNKKDCDWKLQLIIAERIPDWLKIHQTFLQPIY